MAFNTGLSGLRAAQVDLDVTGNNIANSSTVGFKSSRVQFGDLYASGFLSAGNNPIGDGVRVQDVQQQFGQGNINFTDNGLDMAISGDGFFVLNNGGEVRYSRAGAFGVDKEGFVVNNQNMKVQGYTADGDGNMTGIRDDLRIETDNLAPRRTTNLRSDLNLDSREPILERQVAIMGELTPPAGATGFPDGQFTVSYSDGSPSQNITINGADNLSAKDVAARINDVAGMNASATTQLSLADLDDDYVDSAGFDFSIEIDGSEVPLDLTGVNSVDGLINAINTSPSARTLFASVNDAGEFQVVDNQGNTLGYDYSHGADDGDQGTVVGTVNPQADRVVEDVDITGDAIYTDSWDDRSIQTTNSFNPLDQRTYNHATSTTIFDSLGNSHEMTQFYVKNPAPGNGVGQSEWSVYLQIDGEMVAGTENSPYTARFSEDGSLQSVNGDPNGEIVVTDWIPKDPNGDPNGADGPPADPGAVVTPIPEPASSSAFVLDLGNTTQYGAVFGVNDQQQNGYTTGRLSGLDVSDQGVIFARYTNGQSQSLGQVALASFNNTDGLSPVGETTWVETFESGQPVIGAPDTGTLGSIKASSVEESNVDLSEELVNLIIAQRNYQANAKTIEASDAVTQTIINLR